MSALGCSFASYTVSKGYSTFSTENVLERRKDGKMDDLVGGRCEGEIVFSSHWADHHNVTKRQRNGLTPSGVGLTFRKTRTLQTPKAAQGAWVHLQRREVAAPRALGTRGLEAVCRGWCQPPSLRRVMSFGTERAPGTSTRREKTSQLRLRGNTPSCRTKLGLNWEE